MAGKDGGKQWYQQTIKIFAASLLTFFVGITVRGDWVLIFFNLWRYHHNGTATSPNPTPGVSLASIYLKDLHFYLIPSVIVSYVTYFGMAGYFHRYFYINRKDKAHEWKCQAEKFLTPENERHALMVGSMNMTIGALYSGTAACVIMNGAPSKLYYSISDYGIIYAILSAIVVFLLIEGAGYYAHKMYHIPCLYRAIHKWHHRYQQPMVWVSGAMHPIEFLTYQTIFVSPVFFLPLHPFVFLSVILYHYYYGVVDHSGIKMAAIWPWQIHSMYHDNHHRFYHCNFGFNIKFFDWLHGTMHRDDRLYSEAIFGGKGAPLVKEG
ncbi:uncharacterized protein LOC135502292 [Lineus longissimus]|uniref:uncharacterized protein LOC135502292 n=1 Tax=Lineus longissimus TaxID=88925 RepID=UPI00315D8360